MTTEIVQYQKTKELLASDDIRQRFADVLGERTPAFLATVLSAVYESDYLRDAEPNSIVTAAMKAAVLDLPVDPNIGFAWIIPYKEKGIQKARFQLGYKGYIQLALRTGEYEIINAFPIFKGEQLHEDRIKGGITIDGEMESDEVTHYGAYLRLHSGFEKAVVMTIAQINEHAQRYSRSFHMKDGAWQTNFDMMARKTVLKKLLSKWGPLSAQMRTAFEEDEENGIEPDDRLRTPEIIEPEPEPLPELTDEPNEEPTDADLNGGEEPDTLLTRRVALLIEKGLCLNEMAGFKVIAGLQPRPTCPDDRLVEVAREYIFQRAQGLNIKDAADEAWNSLYDEVKDGR